jgi:glycosyltransferase involved in cell wall biosynthesis
VTGPEVSIVIPTFNETDNIAELLDQLSRELSPDLPAEIIFVDDSTDDTPEVIVAVARLPMLAFWSACCTSVSCQAPRSHCW